MRIIESSTNRWMADWIVENSKRTKLSMNESNEKNATIRALFYKNQCCFKSALFEEKFIVNKLVIF